MHFLTHLKHILTHLRFHIFTMKKLLLEITSFFCYNLIVIRFLDAKNSTKNKKIVF